LAISAFFPAVDPSSETPREEEVAVTDGGSTSDKGDDDDDDDDIRSRFHEVSVSASGSGDDSLAFDPSSERIRGCLTAVEDADADSNVDEVFEEPVEVLENLQREVSKAFQLGRFWVVSN